MAAEGSGSGGGGSDRKSSPVPTKSGGTGAAKFLAGLPSRGNFASSSVSSLGGLRVYVCEHSTNPPEGQVIKTDATNILIRHLQLNKQKSEAKDAGSRAPGESSKGKRSAARSLDVNNSAKRPNLGSSSGSPAYAFWEARNRYRGRNGSCPVFKRNRHFFLAEEAISGFSQHTLQSFTVERLRGLLRQSGLSTKGKKDELIARLREVQG